MRHYFHCSILLTGSIAISMIVTASDARAENDSTEISSSRRSVSSLVDPTTIESEEILSPPRSVPLLKSERSHDNENEILKPFAGSNSSASVEPFSVMVPNSTPNLVVSAEGPKSSYLNQVGIYSINLSNSGETDISNVQIRLQPSAGMEVTVISREAEVDLKAGTLTWKVERLATQANELIQMKIRPITEGNQICQLTVSSDSADKKELQMATMVRNPGDWHVSQLKQAEKNSQRR